MATSRPGAMFIVGRRDRKARSAGGYVNVEAF